MMHLHRVKHGLREQVRSAWETHLRPAIAANESHESYAYIYDADDHDVIRAFQQYTDAQAAAVFLLTPQYAAYVAAVEHLLEGPPAVSRTEIIWTKRR
jgi:quinol monooxygenase YgiN